MGSFPPASEFSPHAPLRQGLLHCTLCGWFPAPPGRSAPISTHCALRASAPGPSQSWLGFGSHSKAESLACAHCEDSDYIVNRLMATGGLASWMPPPTELIWYCWAVVSFKTKHFGVDISAPGSGREAGTCYKQPLGHWLAATGRPSQASRLPTSVSNCQPAAPVGCPAQPLVSATEGPSWTLLCLAREPEFEWGRLAFWEASLLSLCLLGKLRTWSWNNSPADCWPSCGWKQNELGLCNIWRSWCKWNLGLQD